MKIKVYKKELETERKCGSCLTNSWVFYSAFLNKDGSFPMDYSLCPKCFSDYLYNRSERTNEMIIYSAEKIAWEGKCIFGFYENKWDAFFKLLEKWKEWLEESRRRINTTDSEEMRKNEKGYLLYKIKELGKSYTVKRRKVKSKL